MVEPDPPALWVPRSSSTGPRHAVAAAAEESALSFQQEFLRMLDQGDDRGPFGSRYTIVGGWRVIGRLDVEILGQALADVVDRHEALRTSIVRDADASYQRVHPGGVPDVTTVDIPRSDRLSRDVRAEEFLNGIETEPFDVHRVPSIRAVVGRFDDTDATLVLVAHHAAVDGWSIQVVMQDLANLYAHRRGQVVPALPAPTRYRDFVSWQRSQVRQERAAVARAYWREHLAGSQVTALRTDRPRSQKTDSVTGWYRFVLADEFRSATVALASRLRSTPFMVLLGAYQVMLAELTGVSDLVVPTFTPGRHPAWTLNTVGSFFNYIPLRTDIAGCRSFGEVVQRTRVTCLAAYRHELSFLEIMEEAPDLMRQAAGEWSASCVFQVVQSPFMMSDRPVGDLRYTAMRRRQVSAPVGSEIPDGALWGLELQNSGGIAGSIGYNRGQFNESTARDLVSRFETVLRRTVSAPDTPPHL